MYEFRCATCGERFEELTRADETPSCPGCGAGDVERLISPVATLRIGLRGGDISLGFWREPEAEEVLAITDR